MTVGEMFDIFPSTNALGAGMGFLNQLTFPNGRKYFDLIAEISCSFVLSGLYVCFGRKREW